MLEKLFSFETVNKGRQPEVDVAKFIAILIMIISHIGITFGDNMSRLWIIGDFIGNEAGAPLFMFCMGLSFCYSKNNSTGSMIKRGCKLILMCLLLNIARAVIPTVIIKNVFKMPTALDLATSFLLTDILIFAGLAMILIALFNKFNINPVVQVLIAILLEAISEFFPGKSTGVNLLDQLVGMFLPLSETTMFSLFNWFVFPAAGQLFGHILLHCRDKKSLYGMLLPVTGLISLYVHLRTYFALYVEGSGIEYYSGGYFYSMGVGPVILALIVVLFVLSLSFFAQSHLSEGVMKFVSTTSTNLNGIFITSWLIITYLRLVLAIFIHEPFHVWILFILTPIIFALSYFISKSIKNRRKKVG